MHEQMLDAVYYASMIQQYKFTNIANISISSICKSIGKHILLEISSRNVLYNINAHIAYNNINEDCIKYVVFNMRCLMNFAVHV